MLKEGMTDDRVPALRERLIQSGDLPKGLHEGDVYDGKLLQALKYYQWRMGLDTDGAVGPATLAQLNTTIGERIEQVEMNLERRRWMQADFGSTYIFVNLADQVLKLVKDEKTIHAAIVQVGLPFHRTPVFTEQMEYLDFNPFWNVPYSIATKEYLPKLKRNPYALSAQNIRVLQNGRSVNPGSIPWSSYSRSRFPVRLRQDPGPKKCPGSREVHVPEQVQHLHPRHAVKVPSFSDLHAISATAASASTTRFCWQRRSSACKGYRAPRSIGLSTVVRKPSSA